jgi:hypothetical protein
MLLVTHVYPSGQRTQRARFFEIQTKKTLCALRNSMHIWRLRSFLTLLFIASQALNGRLFQYALKYLNLLFSIFYHVYLIYTCDSALFKPATNGRSAGHSLVTQREIRAITYACQLAEHVKQFQWSLFSALSFSFNKKI